MQLDALTRTCSCCYLCWVFDLLSAEQFNEWVRTQQNLKNSILCILYKGLQRKQVEILTKELGFKVLTEYNAGQAVVLFRELTPDEFVNRRLTITKGDN